MHKIGTGSRVVLFEFLVSWLWGRGSVRGQILPFSVDFGLLPLIQCCATTHLWLVKWRCSLLARVGKLLQLPARLLQGPGTHASDSDGKRRRKIRRRPQPTVEPISFMNFQINECLYLQSLQCFHFCQCHSALLAIAI